MSRKDRIQLLNTRGKENVQPILQNFKVKHLMTTPKEVLTDVPLVHRGP